VSVDRELVDVWRLVAKDAWLAIALIVLVWILIGVIFR
jgi:hypothetical protein